MSFIELWLLIKPSLEILVLWWIFYRILLFFQGTRAFQVLKGITYLAILFLLAQLLRFDTLNWLLMKFFAISILAMVILFQQELRHGLARLGRGHLFTLFLEESEVVAVISEISDTVFKLSKNRTGAIIAIEREAKLTSYIESGVNIDGVITSELMQTIFHHASPIHDGGVSE